jgi:hypothetical protein
MKALLFLLLAGCDGVFGLDMVPARAVDAAVVDVAPDAALCIDGAADVERFDDPTATPCPWGFFDHGGFDYAIANGEITLTPMASFPGAQAGCGSFGAVAFGSSGQFIELASIGGGYSYLFFRITWPDGATESKLQRSGGDVVYSGPGGASLGTVTFDATTTRFLRLRPETGSGGGVVAEYSADARTWSLIGRDPTPPPATVTPEFEYGTPGPSGDPTPIPAVVAGINACP